MRIQFLTAFIFLLCSIQNAPAQISKIDTADLRLLQSYEDTIRILGDSAVQSTNWKLRESAAVQIIPTLVRALKIKNSFQYPFDSLKTISIIEPADKKFRIITWQLTLKDLTYRYYGTLQMNDENIKLYPLIDMSIFLPDILDTVTDNNNWYGCLYYNVINKKYKKDNYYLLFGWDGNDMFSNRKIVDVMWFDKAGKLYFGKPIFQIGDSLQTRVFIEYKEDASVTLNYDSNLKMIVFDYLSPQNPMEEGIFMTYIPDGTYQGFKFVKGKWVLQRKVFDKKLDVAPYNPPKREGKDPGMYDKN